jgi:hypothetical protein
MLLLARVGARAGAETPCLTPATGDPGTLSSNG